MDELPRSLINAFSKMMIQDQNNIQKRDNFYGTITEVNGKKRVRIDGSNIDTPFVGTTETKKDDRVLILLKEHTAQVIGNLSKG